MIIVILHPSQKCRDQKLQSQKRMSVILRGGAINDVNSMSASKWAEAELCVV